MLLTTASTDEQLSALGEILYQSHYSYSRCGLGSDGTDRLVILVQQLQQQKKNGSDERRGTLFGAIKFNWLYKTAYLKHIFSGVTYQRYNWSDGCSIIL